MSVVHAAMEAELRRIDRMSKANLWKKKYDIELLEDEDHVG